MAAASRFVEIWKEFWDNLLDNSRHIKTVTGHKSDNSIESYYSRASF